MGAENVAVEAKGKFHQSVNLSAQPTVVVAAAGAAGHNRSVFRGDGVRTWNVCCSDVTLEVEGAVAEVCFQNINTLVKRFI